MYRFTTTKRRKALRRTSAITVAAAVMAVAAACGSSPSSPSGGDKLSFDVTNTSVKPSGKGDKDVSDLKIRFLNQIDGAPFYQRVDAGVQAAAKSLGIKDVSMTGPPEHSSAQQVQIFETWITQGVDVIAVDVTDPSALAPSIKKAVDRGILVITWDVDAPESERQLMVNFWDPIKGPQTIWDEVVKQLPPGTKGKWAISIPTLTAKTHVGWIDAIKEYAKKTSPDLKLLQVFESEANQPVAAAKAKALLQANPDLVALLSVDSAGTPGNAQAVRELGLQGKVVVNGLSTPSQMKPFIKDGTVDSFVLWDPARAGYLTVEMAAKLLSGDSVEDGQTWDVADGEPFKVEVQPALFGSGPMAIAGDAIVFTKENIDDLKF